MEEKKSPKKSRNPEGEKIQYKAGSEVGQVLNPAICLSLWKTGAVRCPGPVCLQDFCLALLNPRQRNSHSWTDLGMLIPFSILNLLSCSERSQIQQDFPKILTLAQVVPPGRILHPCFLGVVLVLPKSFQVMGREGIGGKTKVGMSWMGWRQLWRGSRGGEGKVG